MQASPRLHRSPDAVVRFTFIAATALAAGLAWPARASAQEACGDQTCGKGFTCETSTAPCTAIARRQHRVEVAGFQLGVQIVQHLEQRHRVLLVAGDQVGETERRHGVRVAGPLVAVLDAARHQPVGVRDHLRDVGIARAARLQGGQRGRRHHQAGVRGVDPLRARVAAPTGSDHQQGTDCREPVTDMLQSERLRETIASLQRCERRANL